MHCLNQHWLIVNQCWLIVNWALKNKLQRKLIKVWNSSFTKMHLKKSSVKSWPFCPGRGELNYVLLPLLELILPVFCFIQCFLCPRSAGMLMLGQRVGAIAARPLQHRRGSVAMTGRRGTAKLQPGIRFLGTRGAIVPRPGTRCWVRKLVSPGIMRPLPPTHTTGRAVAHCLWVKWWHWWLEYLLNKSCILHLISFVSMMLWNKTHDAHLFVVI